MGEIRNAYKIVVGNRGGKRALGKPLHRSEDNTKTVVKEIG
jgi:hypothetical protein